MVKSGKEADLIVAIDGCPVQCAAKVLQHAEIEPAIQIIVTELGIEKSHDLNSAACATYNFPNRSYPCQCIGYFSY